MTKIVWKTAFLLSVQGLVSLCHYAFINLTKVVKVVETTAVNFDFNIFLNIFLF